MPESTPVIDNSEAYQPQSWADLEMFRERVKNVADLQSLNTAELKYWHKAALADESLVLGVYYQDDPETFLAKHNELLDELEADLTEALPGQKEALASGITDFLGLEGEDATRVQKTLLARSEQTKEVIVKDTLLESLPGFNARFLTNQRQIVFSSRALTNSLARFEERQDFDDYVNGVLLSHEILHSFMMSGTQDTFVSPHLNVKNGLRINDIKNPHDKETAVGRPYGRWINEAILELVRRSITETDIKGASYTPGVMVLELAEKLDPGIVREAAETAFVSGSPGKLFGRFEALFGPEAIIDLDEAIFIASRDGVSAIEKEVLGLLPHDRLPEAKAQLVASKSKYPHSLSDFPK